MVDIFFSFQAVKADLKKTKIKSIKQLDFLLIK